MRAALICCPLFTLACGAGAHSPTAPVETSPPPTAPPIAASASSVAALELPPEPAPESLPASAGGMWLPSQLTSAAHRDRLKALGLALQPAALADPQSYPLSAVVSLGGCSASFVSSDGLVITNHHCVTGALQYNSRPGKDLLSDGFHARTHDDEASIGPTGRVYVTLRTSDVSATLRKGLERIADPSRRNAEVERRTKQAVAACEKGHPELRCEVTSLFGGESFALVEKLALRDVRLVYAPPAGIGNFGGEVDNWRWPRHSGDFSFYRAYVGKDGQPADYAPDNVPYHPKSFLRVAREPLRQGDLVMVAGYPGRTQRLSTAAEVDEAVTFAYPRRLAMCEAYLAEIARVGASDEDARLKGTPLRRGLDNARTYTEGALLGLTQGGTLAARQAEERDLAAWIAAAPERQKQYQPAIDALARLAGERRASRDLDAWLEELQRVSTLFNAALTLVRMAEERPRPDADRKPEYQARNHADLLAGLAALDKRYSSGLDVALTTLAFQRAATLLGDRAAPLLDPLVGPSRDPAVIAEAVKATWATTKLGDGAERARLFALRDTRALAASKDPLVRLALALRPHFRALDDRGERRAGELVLHRASYVSALRAQVARDVAPDANFTLRVTYGTVKGYRPRPGAEAFRSFTRLSDIPRKHTGQAPFAAPRRLLDEIARGHYEPYESSELHDVPVDFLSDCDITGGNSGSATLDARGELVGLAFDGDYEAMASDWRFMPELTRAIHVDLRYVLFVLHRVADAKELMAELGVWK